MLKIVYLRFLKLSLSILIFSCFLASSLNAQQLDSNRIYDWKRAGLITEFDNSIQSYNAIDLGAINDGVNDNSLIVNSVIEDLDSASTLFFPAGFYFFKSTIKLKSDVTILGELGKTFFVFDSMPLAPCFLMQGTWNGASLKLKENVGKKQRYVLIQNSTLEPNQIIFIGDNDSANVFSNWAINSTGQFVKVKSISTDIVFLFSELRRNYNVNLNASFRKCTPLKNTSISNLIILRRDTTEAQTSNILLDKAYNCEVRCVESYSANFAHVSISNSLNINVNGCYFKDANGYGGGGNGYGIALQFASSECKVYNNIFNHLRHSILLQAGANGNFVGYNYSLNPFWTETSLPSDAAGDLVLHGNYVYANLFEGNVVQNIVIDDSHGMNGPNNVFLRNRALGYGIFMNPQIPSDSQIFIGNEITNKSFLKGLYNLAGEGNFEFGNNVDGNCIPQNTQDVTLKSLYFSSTPVEYKQLKVWPLIGYPTDYQSHTNFAQARDLLEGKTDCRKAIGSTLNIIAENHILLYPNPTSNYFNIENGKGIASVRIVNTLGQVVVFYTNSQERYSFTLPAGIYWAEIVEESQTSIIKLIVR